VAPQLFRKGVMRHNGISNNHFCSNILFNQWKTTLIPLIMYLEDDHILFVNGRQPQNSQVEEDEDDFIIL
jgi:hypothetical protein